MRALLLLLVVWTSIASAQNAPSLLPLPATLMGFMLVDSAPAEGGLSYVYRDSTGHRADVVLIPLTAEDRAMRSDRKRLERQAELVRESFKEARRRGDFVRLEFPVDDTLASSSRPLPPGRILVAVMRKDPTVGIVFTHLFLVHDRFLRVHLTLLADELKLSTAPDFALELAEALGGHTP